MVFAKFFRNVLVRPLLGGALILSLLPGPSFAIDTQDSQIFISGFNAYQKKDYASAIDKMSQVLQKYPDSPLRDMAIFWLARSNFKAGHNKDAARYMAQFFKEYPDSPLKSTVEEDLVALVGKYQKGETIVDKAAPAVAQAAAEDKGAKEKAAKEKVDAERLAQEKAAKEKAAAEQAAKAKAEADRLAAEQAAKAKAEAERQAAEKLAKEKAEAERVAQAKAATEKAAAEQAAKAKAEADRLAAEQAAKAKAEAEQQAAEKLAREKAEADRVAQEKAAREKAEAERLAIEKAFREKAEQERLAVEKAFREKAEAERLAAGKARAALEKAAAPVETVTAAPVPVPAPAPSAVVATASLDSLRAAKAAAEKALADKTKELAELQEPAGQKGLASIFLRERSSYRKDAIARVTAEKAGAEKDLADAQAALDRALAGQAPMAQAAIQPGVTATAKVAEDKAAADRLAAEQAATAKAEAERQAAEKLAREKADAERLAAEKAAREKLAGEQAAKAKAEADRMAAEQAAKAKADADRQAAEKLTREKAEADRLAQEKATAEQAAKAKAETDRLAAEQDAKAKAEAERQAVEKLAREKAETERLAQEKAAQDKAVAEAAGAKAEADRKAAEEAAAIKLAAEKIVKGKTEEERLAEEKEVAEQARQAAILLEVSKAKAAEKARKQAELEARFKAEEEAKAEEARKEELRAAREQEEKEQQADEKLAREKAEAERLAKEKAAREKVAAEQAAAAKAEAERLATERAAKEKAEAERLAREKVEQQRLAADKAAREKAEQERLAATEKAAREKADKEKAEKERLAATERAAARNTTAVAAVAEKPAPAAPAKAVAAAAPKAAPARKTAAGKEEVAKRTALRDRAIAEYKSLVDRYPGSKAAALATAKLRELGIAYPAGAAVPPAAAAAVSTGENAKVLSLEVGQYSDLDFTASPDAPSYEVGKQISVPFEITNRGNSRDSFTLESSFPDEYALRFVAAGEPDKPLTKTPPLNSGEKFKGVALLTIPSRYIDGEKVIFPVKAASEFDPVVSQSRGISLIASSPLLRAVIKTDRVQVLPGERVPYKVTLLNIGSAAARQLTMRLTYPPQYEPVDLSATGFREEGKGVVAVDGLQLASGESREFSIAFRLKDEALARQELFVRAETDNLSLKRKDAFLSAAAVVQPVSGVVVVAHTDRVVVIPGQTATIPLTVTNTGNIRDDFSLRPVVPKGLAYAFYLDLNRDGVRQANEPLINHVGPLAPKEVANVVMEIASSAAEKDGVSVPLTLAFEPESDKTKGASVAVSMVYSRPVVNLAMAGKGGKMKPGEVSTFELDCGNSGSSLAKIVEIQSLMPEQIELVASDPGFSKRSDGTYSWKFEELGAGEKRSIKVTYRVKSGTAVGTTLQLKNMLKYQDRLGNVY